MSNLFHLQDVSFHFPFPEPVAQMWPHFSVDGLFG